MVREDRCGVRTDTVSAPRQLAGGRKSEDKDECNPSAGTD